MFLQVTPILFHSYAFLPSITSWGCVTSSGFFSSFLDDLLDVDLFGGGVLGDGFSVCAGRNKIIC